MLKLIAAAVVLLAVQAQDDNKEYKGWTGCKPGSWTSLTMDITTDGHAMTMETTKTLKSIDEKEAVVEFKMTMNMGGRKMEPPAQERHVPAKGGEVRPIKDAAEGDEELELAGKKIKCHWMKCAVEMEKFIGTSKVWFTDEIPGAIAKFETISEDGKATKMKMIVTGWEKK